MKCEHNNAVKKCAVSLALFGIQLKHRKMLLMPIGFLMWQKQTPLRGCMLLIWRVRVDRG